MKNTEDKNFSSKITATAIIKKKKVEGNYALFLLTQTLKNTVNKKKSVIKLLLRFCVIYALIAQIQTFKIEKKQSIDFSVVNLLL